MNMSRACQARDDQSSTNRVPSSLSLWAGDADGKASDFLAVIDAAQRRSASPARLGDDSVGNGGLILANDSK
jgi:hypothetical protein